MVHAWKGQGALGLDLNNIKTSPILLLLLEFLTQEEEEGQAFSSE